MKKRLAGLIVCLCFITAGIAATLGTAFTYQGRLAYGGAPANGNYDFTFNLYATNTGGTPLGLFPIQSGVPVSNGVFTVTLDFGASAFQGDARWVEIAVRPTEPSGMGIFTVLAPRQHLTPTPNALFSANAAAAATVASGGVVNSSLAPNSVTSEKITDATIDGSDLNATLASNTFWRLNGNSGAAPGTHFVGTTDDQPLEFKVGGKRALRLERGLVVMNFIAGSFQNSVAPGIDGATIAGGGQDFGPHSVSASYATIGGGAGNEIGEDAELATIGGGGYSTIHSNSYNSTISGGGFNEIWRDSHSATISGGLNNVIQNHSAGSTICGGSQNTVGGDAGQATIGGGTANSIQDSSFGATVAGGYYNTVRSQTANATIGGGNRNTVDSNTAFCTISGGFTNWVGPNAWAATVGGGESNVARGTNSTVPGGLLNVAAGNYSFATGRRAKANHVGTFVWADSSDFDFPSAETKEFAARATGGVRFVSGLDSNGVPATGVSLPAGSGSWSSLSDRNAKTDFTPVNPRDVLERLAEIPIQSWRYKTEAASVCHLGPVAQDFTAAFNLGTDDQHIATVDADGVALAAIQGLNQKLEERLKAKEVELEAVKQRLAAIEKLLASQTIENGVVR